MFSCSCDTMVVMSDVTQSGSIIFGKNSDRQANEPLAIRYAPSAIHLPNSKIQATYIEIDQVEQTNSCILFCPTNIFGAEMGFNSHGLVIGNEALFTKIPSYSKGLTGMDLVRLVLERCSTSKEGKNTIINLLNKYGQGGNCGFTSPFYYHSSFLIVDSNEAWIIETVGKDYAAKRIRSGIYTISNKISFGSINTFDEYSSNLIEQAIQNGWCHEIQDFHFEKCYSGFSFNPKQFYNAFIKTKFASSSIRQSRSKYLINKSSAFTLNDMFHVLRDHQNSQNSPSHGLTNVDICMHAAYGPIRFNQTTGSLVSVIPTSNQQIPTHYATCTSLTCLSVFKPIWLDSTTLPPPFISSKDKTLSNPSSTYSSNNIWWKSEIMTRNVMKYYSKLIKNIQIERDELENEIIISSQRLASSNIPQQQRNSYTALCFDKVDQLTNTWFSRAYYLSFEDESELSLCQEQTWNSWRKSGNIPKKFLIYNKVEFDKRIVLSVSILLLSLMSILLTGYYFQNKVEQYSIITLFHWTSYTPTGFIMQLIHFVLLVSSILYILFMEPYHNKIKQSEITLERFNFYEY